MCSTWQSRVNRLNAAKSTGPKTEAGKERSSGNATKHGGYTTRPDDRRGEPVFDDGLKNWVACFEPQNESVHALAVNAYLNMMRMRRLLAVDDADCAFNISAAVLVFDAERRDAVDEAESLLLDKPHFARAVLTSTVLGCDRLLEVLTELEEKFTTGRWDDECRGLLRALGGEGDDTRDDILKAASEFVVKHQIPMPGFDAENRTLDDLIGLPAEPGSAPVAAIDPKLSKRDLARYEKAWEILLGRFDAEREAIERIRESLAGEEERSREMFMIRAQVDFGPEGMTRQRCISTATRAFQRAYDALVKASGVDLTKTAGPIASKSAPTPTRAPVPAAPPARRPEPKSEPAPTPRRNEPKSNLIDSLDSGRFDGVMNFAVGRAPELVALRE